MSLHTSQDARSPLYLTPPFYSIFLIILRFIEWSIVDLLMYSVLAVGSRHLIDDQWVMISATLFTELQTAHNSNLNILPLTLYLTSLNHISQTNEYHNIPTICLCMHILITLCYNQRNMKTEQEDLTQSLLSDSQPPPSTHHNKYLQNLPTINGSNCIQTLLFTWLYPFLSFGSKTTVTVPTMPQLPHQLLTSTQYSKINTRLGMTQRSSREGLTLVKIIAGSYYKPFFKILAFLLVYVIMQTVSPYLTAVMMRYIAHKQDYADYYGVVLFVLVVLLEIVKSVSQTHLGYRFTMLGINLTNSLTLLIYSKSLRFASVAEKEFSESQIVNYSQVDAQRLSNGGYQIAAILVAPLQIIGGILMMYYFIGISFLTGIVVLIVVLVITYFITKRTFHYNKLLLEQKDARMKVTQQILDIIRYIKINSIEKFFFNKVQQKRANQISFYKKKGFMDVLTIFIYWLSCPLILSTTFYTYILLGNQMQSEVAFTTIMIFTTLQYPIRLIPTSISSLVQIFASLKRIQKFLLAPQIEKSHVMEVSDSQSDFAVKIERGNFYFGIEKPKQDKKDEKQSNKQKYKSSKIEQNILQERNNQQSNTQKINQNQLTINQVSDKEQALQSEPDDSPTTAQKQPSQQLHKPNYIRVLKDISTTIRKSNFTLVIGDIGSGKSSLLLSILNQMIPSDQSKIQINGSIAYAAQKPWIISSTVKNNIIFESPYNQTKLNEVIHYACLQQDLKILPFGLQTEIGQKGINISGGQKARIGLARALYSGRQIYLLDDILSAVDVHVGQFLMRQTLLGYLKGRTIIMPTHAIKFAQAVNEIIVMKKGRIVRKGHFNDIASTPQFQQIYKKEKKKQENNDQHQQKHVKEEQYAREQLIKQAAVVAKVQNKTVADKLIKDLMLPQDQEVGQVNYTIFKQYINLNGGYFHFAFLVCFAMFMWICFTTASSIIMQRWCQNPIQNYDLYIYAALSLGSNLFIFFRVYKLVLSSCRQGQIVHRQMIKSLLYASLGNFFNRIPIGRILNRLTKDLRQLDEAIAFKVGNVLVNIFMLLGDLAICIYGSTPYVIIPIIVVGYLSHRVRKYFMKSQIEVARYQKSTNSPIVSGFVSAISGLSTIRAYRMQQQFTNKQITLFDQNKRVRLTKAGMDSWFSINLTYLSFVVNVIAIGYCLLSENSNASLGGLLMNYAINLSSDINQFTNSITLFQAKLISLQRIYSFMKIEPQTPYLQYCNSWDSKEEGCREVIIRGDIEFNNVFARYRMDLPDALKGISCRIKAGEKVGIVGRTGAGKTTLINTLLRITEISQGELLIDGTKIENYFIKQLRNNITMIDQEPTLLKSTFKQNLDITGRYSDQQIYEILQQCNLYETVTQKGGLNALVSNDSLSAGEKQLICICRAFLKHSKIVLVDEATANIDVKNDSIIQRVIGQKFKECTVLTIAHRLSTLMNSDKIIVMESGRMVQFGSPGELQAKQKGFYKQMVLKNAKQFLT